MCSVLRPRLLLQESLQLVNKDWLTSVLCRSPKTMDQTFTDVEVCHLCSFPTPTANVMCCATNIHVGSCLN